MKSLKSIEKKYGMVINFDCLIYEDNKNCYIPEPSKNIFIITPRKFLRQLRKTYYFPKKFEKDCLDGLIRFNFDIFNNKNILTVEYDYSYTGEEYLPKNLSSWFNEVVLGEILDVIENYQRRSK